MSLVIAITLKSSLEINSALTVYILVMVSKCAKYKRNMAVLYNSTWNWPQIMDK